MTAVFTPDDEPYLGLDAVFMLDRVISLTMAQQAEIAEWTRSNRLTDVQQIAAEVVPPSLSIALSIRELVRQAYLTSALILLRPLFERSATLAYLLAEPQARPLWADGWLHSERPSLRVRAKAMAPAEVSCSGLVDPDQLVDRYNSLVHGDPVATLHSAILLGDGSAGYTSAKDTGSPSRAAAICTETWWRIVYLNVRCAELFPDVAVEGLDADADGNGASE